VVVAYRLGAMHTRFRALLPPMFGALLKRYPQAPLKEVGTFAPKGSDRSMGHALISDGTIKFNLYWFAQDPAVLAAAARTRPDMPLGNDTSLAFHGAMVDEPLHVVTHEFGHCLAVAHKGAEALSRQWWREACLNPGLAPAAYALVNPIEYWAELFAAFELQAHIGPHIDEMRVFLGK